MTLFRSYFRHGIASLLATFAGLCPADDLVPAPFRGASPSATVQEWDYLTGAVPLTADGNTWGTGGNGFVNPYGTPRLSATTAGASWQTQAGGGLVGMRNGVWSLPFAAEAIAHDVPGDPETADHQAHWIQVTWFSPLGALNPPVVLVTTASGPVPADMLTVRTLGDGWFHGVFTTSTGPSIPSPRVTVLAAGNQFLIDQLVVDAVCTRRRVVVPDRLAVRFGRIERGDVSSLRADDNDALRVCRFLVPNTTVPPVQVEVEATTSNLSNVLGLVLGAKSRMVHAGSFRQTLEHYNFAQGSYGSASNTQPFPPTFAVYSVSALGNVADYIGPSGALKGRWSVRQVGPASVSVWCAEVEQWEWEASL